MRVYYDTEFWERGAGYPVSPISVGMVAEDGREFYAINRDARWDCFDENGWLRDNVMPHLPGKRTNWGFRVDRDHPAVMSKKIMRQRLVEFLMDTSDIELWAWYGAYDHVVLCQLFGAMVDLPPYMPKWTNDLRQETFRLGDVKLPPATGDEHHALADARWVRKSFHALVEYADSMGYTRPGRAV